MDHYQDITILPDPEFSSALLMGALYNKLHRALVALAATNIGVSFPQYSVKPKGVGAILRIHSDQESLNQLQKAGWLKGMTDHTSVTDILPAPGGVTHKLVTRRQFKTNVERLRRRRMKRKSESYEAASEAIPQAIERKPDLPFITIRSASTSQSFCLFIEQKDAQEAKGSGAFNSYGFSQTTTVPWF
ncbi:type I-F CRISPR-associated endoribonuclease Cas6/Csy4 [Gilvimarinus japonicus]|uniref:Type I-F CRISPR-associated endoribonuclease Cas6/Csy4 n=1 Tax=Gilvimarinus japonicus TaxID=1796469 RepID=A0ABV7HUU6_9GAMM